MSRWLIQLLDSVSLGTPELIKLYNKLYQDNQPNYFVVLLLQQRKEKEAVEFVKTQEEKLTKVQEVVSPLRSETLHRFECSYLVQPRKDVPQTQKIKGHLYLSATSLQFCAMVDVSSSVSTTNESYDTRDVLLTLYITDLLKLHFQDDLSAIFVTKSGLQLYFLNLKDYPKLLKYLHLQSELLQTSFQVNSPETRKAEEAHAQIIHSDPTSDSSTSSPSPSTTSLTSNSSTATTGSQLSHKKEVFATFYCIYWDEEEKPLSGFLSICFYEALFHVVQDRNTPPVAVPNTAHIKFAWKDVSAIENKKRLLKKYLVFSVKDKDVPIVFSAFESISAAFTEANIIYKAWKKVG